jgi:anhydro-N-acetylmuramic acid kinase
MIARPYNQRSAQGEEMKNRDPIWALGAMSGTSMDGVDAALVKTDGETILEFGSTGYQEYSPEEREVLQAAQGCWQGDERAKAAARVVENAHVRLLSQFEGAEIVGFHGQTLAHDAASARTHQVGAGGNLARALGRPVVWDFRTADMALGGQGAPLAPFFHFALARWICATEPLAILNLGGVGNLTWIDPGKARPDEDGALIAFDTGPGNAPMDDLLRNRTGEKYDPNGSIAAGGKVDQAIMEAALATPYFMRMPPKSLDRGDFDDLGDAVADLDLADALATLAAITAGAVVTGIDHCPTQPSRVLVAGGGRLNATLMAMLKAALDCPVDPVEAAGLDGDMLEAQAFAHLAVRVVRHLPTSAPGTTGVAAPVAGGVVSRP